jgi:hypothetical protein
MVPGDVIGFSGRSLLSDVINITTYGIPRWSISHVGIVAAYKGQYLLWESTTLDDTPCCILNRFIKGVQAHPLCTITRYKGRVWHYPLVQQLSEEESHYLTEFLLQRLGVPYDEIGAIRSGGAGFSLVESMLRPENLASIFCSELVAAAHRSLGLIDTGNVSRWSPNFLVREERRRGILAKPERQK